MQTKTVLAYYANYTISILCKITWFAWTPAQFGGHLVQLKLRPTCHSTLEEGKINKQTKEGVGNLAPAYKKKSNFKKKGKKKRNLACSLQKEIWNNWK